MQSDQKEENPEVNHLQHLLQNQLRSQIHLLEQRSTLLRYDRCIYVILIVFNCLILWICQFLHHCKHTVWIVWGVLWEYDAWQLTVRLDSKSDYSIQGVAHKMHGKGWSHHYDASWRQIIFHDLWQTSKNFLYPPSGFFFFFDIPVLHRYVLGGLIFLQHVLTRIGLLATSFIIDIRTQMDAVRGSTIYKWEWDPHRLDVRTLTQMGTTP